MTEKNRKRSSQGDRKGYSKSGQYVGLEEGKQVVRNKGSKRAAKGLEDHHFV